MAKFYMFFGAQAYEFERPNIPESILKKGVKIDINKSKYSLDIKPSKTKAVIRNVYDKAK